MNILLKKLRESKTGVAEVIGSLIIILIVAIAGVIVYAYSVNVIGTTSSRFSIQTEQNEELIQERFEIVRTWSNQDIINITVLNFGRTDLSIVSVYVNGTAVSSYDSDNSIPIGPGQLVNVKFASPFEIQVGSCLQILAVSERGGKNTVLYQT
jgi:hypothetical protein